MCTKLPTQVSIDEKSHQWFGATVASSGEDGVVVVSFDIALVTLVTTGDILKIDIGVDSCTWCYKIKRSHFLMEIFLASITFL